VIWNRTAERARDLADRLKDLDRPVAISDDLDGTIGQGDVISSATMTQTPIIKGALLKDGAHLDLVGAFRPDMREADDDALTRGRVFVDCFDTTIDEIGEIKIPIERGIISREDVLADFYGLATGAAGRESDQEITVFKNGGGAHLDILTASAIAAAV
jgi:ornithine cyclodeaminase